jgi:PncC family amidohydrolase
LNASYAVSAAPAIREPRRRAFLTIGTTMDKIWSLGSRAGALLKARREMVAVAETSAGGLISASLLAVPGASRYFAGGAVTYSARSIRGLAGISIEEMRANGIRSSSEPYAQLLAAAIRSRHGDIAWGLSESGAAGPEGNSYGDPAGHSCMAVSGTVNMVRTLRTGQSDRLANMWAFAEATLALFIEALQSAPATNV